MINPSPDIDGERNGGALPTLRWNLETLGERPARVRPPGDIRALVCSTEELPPLPEIARRLMRLLDDPDADAGKLAGIVELDPLLSAQVIRWSNSALYAVRRPVESVKDAIVRVLGFDLVLSLALGLAALDPLQTPRLGPIGRDAVWRHAVRCSALMQSLRPLLPEANRPSPGLVQLAGLTQNIGYLLLGHLLPAQFAFLSRIVQANPLLDLLALEPFVLGVTHCQLGHWLLDAWTLPPPLLAAVAHHHNPAYQGPHEHLVLLSCLADRLLAEVDQAPGPAPQPGVVDGLMERLAVSREQCVTQRDRLFERPLDLPSSSVA